MTDKNLSYAINSQRVNSANGTMWYCGLHACFLTIVVFKVFLSLLWFWYLLVDTVTMKCATTVRDKETKQLHLTYFFTVSLET
jgi:hypothetical protein